MAKRPAEPTVPAKPKPTTGGSYVLDKATGEWVRRGEISSTEPQPPVEPLAEGGN